METVLIIGASSSIGSAITERFRGPSTRIITTSTSGDVGTANEKEVAMRLNLSNDESIDTFVRQVEELTSEVGIAVFLAGILPGKSLEEYKTAEIDEVMSVNFNGQAKLIMKMLPLLTKRSRLLLFSSISAQRGSYDPIYAASKGAILSFVKSLATNLPQGARINAIAPGLIEDSAMFHAMAPDRREFHRNQLPSKNLLGKQELAEIVFDLCQDHWAHVNGACIDINGGQNVR